MSDHDLRSLYENVRRGDEYVAPRRESELYGDVYNTLNENVGLYTKAKQGGYKHLGDVSDQDFVKINRMVTSGDAIKQIQAYLSEKQYTPESFKGADDYRILIELLDDAAFENYITQKRPKLSAVKSGNILDIMSQAGINSTMAQRIARYTPIDKTGSNLGPGEILLALTFMDVTNSTIGGDLMIGNKKLEVKGQGGRFGQQGGRGGVAFDVSPLFSYLDESPEMPVYNTGKPVVNLEILMRSAYNAYVAEGKQQQFLKNVQALFKTAYPNGNISKFINKHIDFNSITSRKQLGDFRRALTKLNYDHYSTSHDTNLFLFIDKEMLNFAMFNKPEALADGGLIDSSTLYCGSFTVNELYPNFYYRF